MLVGMKIAAPVKFLLGSKSAEASWFVGGGWSRVTTTQGKEARGSLRRKAHPIQTSRPRGAQHEAEAAR
jgi:hypothetical protein